MEVLEKMKKIEPEVGRLAKDLRLGPKLSEPKYRTSPWSPRGRSGDLPRQVVHHLECVSGHIKPSASSHCLHVMGVCVGGRGTGGGGDPVHAF